MNWYPVKHFPLDADLRALTTYLQQRGLIHRIVEDQGQQLLEVVDEQVIPSLQEFLQDYTQGRIQFSAPPPVATATVNTQRPDIMVEIQSAPITVALILLSACGTLLTQTDWGFLGLHFFSFQDFDIQGRVLPLMGSLQAGEIWRLLTPVFIHFSLFHLLFNSLWVWDFGRRLEYLMGRMHFLLFFALTGVASNIVQFLWSGSSMFGGMSGVVYALLGFIAVRQRLAPHPLVMVPNALIGFMLFWLVLCMTDIVNYFISGSIANAAHLGGLIAGALYALATRHLYPHSRAS